MELLAIASMAAVYSWAMCKEEVFQEYRDWYSERHTRWSRLLQKLGYIPTCEYCFSFWFLVMLCMIFKPSVHYAGWRGYILAHGVIWGITVIILSLYQLLRTAIRRYQE